MNNIVLKPLIKKVFYKADEEIRTLDPLLGKEMLYHWATSAGCGFVRCALTHQSCTTKVQMVNWRVNKPDGIHPQKPLSHWMPQGLWKLRNRLHKRRNRVQAIAWGYFSQAAGKHARRRPGNEPISLNAKGARALKAKYWNRVSYACCTKKKISPLIITNNAKKTTLCT